MSPYAFDLWTPCGKDHLLQGMVLKQKRIASKGKRKKLGSGSAGKESKAPLQATGYQA